MIFFFFILTQLESSKSFTHPLLISGGLADDHDVLHFLTTSLHTPGQGINDGGRKISTEEEIKLGQEYQDYQKKLEQQKKDYRE